VLRNALPLSNRYPRAEYDLLVAKIAVLHAVKPEQIVLGCGSSEILLLAAAEFLGPGKRLIQAAPTCPLLRGFALSVGAEVIEVLVTQTCEHDLDAMMAHARDSAGLVYICNPNNPTGTLTPRKDIEIFIRKLPAKMMVLIDEAYHHFVSPSRSYASFLDQPLDDPRVIVTRTFSTMYGLAGMRVGYAVATPEIARRFSSHQLYRGISVVSAMAAAAALDDSEYVRLCAKRNADDRQEFLNQVNGRFLEAFGSQTNFLMLKPLRLIDQVVKKLKNNNILIGPLIPEMPQFVRVSLGTPAEMREFWRVLDQLPGGGKH
jgi:histidinol-phosphate aminotransferase